MKMQRRMQQRIRMVVEERRTALALPPRAPAERVSDPEATMEIPPRAIGRVTVRPA
jgi:hypothetical protein